MQEPLRDTRGLLDHLDSSPTNILFTNVIRTFGDAESAAGSPAWLRAALHEEKSVPIVEALTSVLRFFDESAAHDLHFYIEKVAGWA
jgi:hypothetical protein